MTVWVRNSVSAQHTEQINADEYCAFTLKHCFNEKGRTPRFRPYNF